MKLITFGDSWVWGDELLEKNEYNNELHSKNIGGVVNNNHSFSDYINYATNGGSNQHIIYDLMNYINSEDYDEDDFIMIGMTSPLRNIIYNNISKTPVTWPGWDYDSYISHCDDKLVGNNDFKNWWKSHVKINLNKRNDILSYTQSCLSIKALLSNHKKYLVWQSIDGNFWEPENDFHEVYLEKYKKDVNSKIEDEFILKKENLNKELKRGTIDTQVWINIEHQDWKSWLEDNYKHDDVFVWSSNHPNKNGIELWYKKILSKIINKTLG
tara:strand:- start:43 stop:849 length:807 start_codon:yes stop_codon:yes gene_type:complete